MLRHYNVSGIQFSTIDRDEGNGKVVVKPRKSLKFRSGKISDGHHDLEQSHKRDGIEEEIGV